MGDQVVSKNPPLNWGSRTQAKRLYNSCYCWQTQMISFTFLSNFWPACKSNREEQCMLQRQTGCVCGQKGVRSLPWQQPWRWFLVVPGFHSSPHQCFVPTSSFQTCPVVEILAYRILDVQVIIYWIFKQSVPIRYPFHNVNLYRITFEHHFKTFER